MAEEIKVQAVEADEPKSIAQEEQEVLEKSGAVSYTHLTLPTILLV